MNVGHYASAGIKIPEIKPNIKISEPIKKKVPTKHVRLPVIDNQLPSTSRENNNLIETIETPTHLSFNVIKLIFNNIIIGSIILIILSIITIFNITSISLLMLEYCYNNITIEVIEYFNTIMFFILLISLICYYYMNRYKNTFKYMIVILYLVLMVLFSINILIFGIEIYKVDKCKPILHIVIVLKSIIIIFSIIFIFMFTLIIEKYFIKK
ncbi:cation transport ATPase [Alphaentomopoxvirus acuprea]|uniref:Cation transport ATPase n=1 Tax=Alphaentomopoxvirus acuprea TaxID=62099 RepID=W6JLH1_9POXV|nr:cation transport ATPase [Anomala cuprea entomopoxvirus]BAO49461.1 cation transport ATPase [Anomala cuprea entomopoxvirus]